MTNETHSSFYGYVCWAFGLTFYFFEFFLGVFPGTIAVSLMERYHLSPEEFSFVSTAYYFVYGFIQVPVGYLADRFGPRKVMTAALFVCGTGMTLFYLSDSFIFLFLSRCLMGLGSAFAFVSTLILLLNWFPRKRFGFYGGITQLSGTLGPVLAGGPFSIFMQKLGPDAEKFSLALAAFGFFLGILVAIFLRDKREESKKTIVYLEKFNQPGVKAVLKKKAGTIIAVVLFGGLVYCSVPLFGAVWGTTYLMVRGFDQVTASFITSLVWIGMAFTCPILGKISELTFRRKPVMLFGTLLGIVGSALLLYFPPGKSIVFIGMCVLFIGIAAGAQALSFAIMSEIVPKSCNGAFIGLTNSIIVLSGAIAPVIVGTFLKQINNTFTLASFERGLSLMLLVFFLGLIVLLLFVPETFCRHQEEMHKVKIKQRKKLN